MAFVNYNFILFSIFILSTIVESQDVFKRIVGGNEVSIQQTPWQTLIRQRVNNQSSIQCGAVLVDIYWIVTAAHCIKEPLDLFPIEAYFGVSDLKSFRNTVRRVIKIYNPVNYDFTLDGDLLLLRLNQSIELSGQISPIRLPELNDNFDYSIGVVSGYGVTHFDLTNSMRPADHLNMVRVPIFPKSSCIRLYTEAFKDGAKATEMIISRKLICAGHIQGGTDACIGDSGGPLAVCVPQRNLMRYNREKSLFEISNKESSKINLKMVRYLFTFRNHRTNLTCKGVWKLAGIISKGYHCAEPRIPGLYTEVSVYTNWIRSIIRSNP